VVPFDSAAITLIEGDHLKIVALGGTSRHTKQLGDQVGKTQGLFALMENTHSPLVLADAQLHPRYEQWSKEKKDLIHGWMGIPLIAYERTIGYLMLNSQVQDVYTADHASLGKTFANQAAVAIEKARLFEQVRNGRERLQALTKKLVEIQEAERQFIARELHDEIGQDLTGLQFILALGSEGPEAKQHQAFKEAQDLVSRLMSKVRELSVNLHPAMLDDLGLLPTLKAHFERYLQQTGIQVHFKSENMKLRFPAEVELSAYRVVQEALTNVARYAAVKEVDVSLFTNDTSLFIRIEDGGQGFDMNILKDSAGAFGLAGMRERIFLIGGKFDVFSSPGTGTRITAVIPIATPLERRANDRQGIVGR
jgi:signal transduction histidine kinase